MTWRAISLATWSNSWWPLWLLRLCLMQSSWRNQWRYEPNLGLRFNCVIKNNDLLPAHTWEMGVNRTDLGVILMLRYSSGRTVLKWGTVVEPWAQCSWAERIASYPNFISLVFDPKSQILHFVVIESRWHHHQPHCLGQKPRIIFDPLLSLTLQSSQNPSASPFALFPNLSASLSVRNVCVSLKIHCYHSSSTTTISWLDHINTFLLGPLPLFSPTWNPFTTE